MAFQFKERPDSGASTSNPPTLTLRYVANGSNDRSFVKGFALSQTLPFVATQQGNLYRQDVLVEPQGHKLFYVTVPYAQRKYQVGQFRFSVSSTGGSFHIKTSRQTVARYPSDATDHKQLIGVNGDNVDGVDIVIPAMKLTCHFKHPLADGKTVSRRSVSHQRRRMEPARGGRRRLPRPQGARRRGRRPPPRHSPAGMPSYVFRWQSTGAPHCSGLMKSPDNEDWYVRFQPATRGAVGEMVPEMDAETGRLEFSKILGPLFGRDGDFQ
jgi:hypothetical protein